MNWQRRQQTPSPLNFVIRGAGSVRVSIANHE
jgi:hypothetical protein